MDAIDPTPRHSPPVTCPFPGKRIAVVGTTGSGKTTLACQLAQQLGYPHIEMDSLHWGPNWTEVPRDVFRARVDEALRDDNWVIDGNYGKARDIVWSRADTLVWLDYGLPVIFWRLFWRTFKRIVTKEKLWSGNQERWKDQLAHDSLFLWVLTSRPRHRRDYPQLLASPEYAHLQVVHLHSPREADEWMKSINQRQNNEFEGQRNSLFS